MKSKCLVIAAMLVTSVAACGGSGATSSTGTGTGTGTGKGPGTGTSACTAGGGTICVQGTSFSPVDITIAKGGIATWTEVAGDHNIVFDPPRALDVADIGAFSDGSVKRTFASAGTFAYHCTIHGGVGTGMHGNVIVQ